MRPNILWLGYILGIVMLVVGVLVLLGQFGFQGDLSGNLPVRTIFGLVLILYGIYRLAITEMQRRRIERTR